MCVCVWGGGFQVLGSGWLLRGDLGAFHMGLESGEFAVSGSLWDDRSTPVGSLRSGEKTRLAVRECGVMATEVVLAQAKQGVELKNGVRTRACV